MLLNCGDQQSVPPEAVTLAGDVALVTPRDLPEPPDVIFEMGGGLDVEWLDYARALGKKVVFFCCGQPYVGLIEPSVFQRNGYFSRATRCDEIWLLGKDRALMPMLRTLHRCPVYEVPFLWNSAFIDQRIRTVEQAGLRFGYEPRSARGETGPLGLCFAVLEPNISVVKCCVVPMLIAEAAYRADGAAVRTLHVLNGAHLREHPSFSFLLNAMDLTGADRVRLDGRHDFAGFMSQNADAVIAHQWQNDQNILYLDTLYGGYPLIHNSPWLSHLGYFYGSSDIEAGASQLLRAVRHHNTEFRYYAQRARSFLMSLAPRASENCSAYARRLLALNAKPAGIAA